MDEIPELAYRHERGPFDIIGDVHGCYDELWALLKKLGWRSDDDGQWTRDDSAVSRQVVFLGDLVDRGPGVVEVLRLVMEMVEDGNAICLLGNHDDKLARKLAGRNVKVAHGLEDTLAQLEREPSKFVGKVAWFLSGLASYYVLDEGRLIVAHAGIKEEMIGESGSKVRAFTLYGDTTGKVDEFGFPLRRDWAANYRGEAMVVYGHTPVRQARWVNKTINIDTGCVFGGRLTALRYPDRELVSVPAKQVYYERGGGIRET